MAARSVEPARLWKPCTMTRSVLCSSPDSSSWASKLKRGCSGRSPSSSDVSTALVTVMSVPSPYSDCRTFSWALPIPEDTEPTTMTSAMPSARPEATTRAVFLRRRSSRLR
ncbi:hypothetical protein A4U61_14055 [Streptomyces sp. H-KF8]|nr:hypothetical protein A4U61_14055 [Streptomyces sp. H-KF8]